MLICVDRPHYASFQSFSVCPLRTNWKFKGHRRSKNDLNLPQDRSRLNRVCRLSLEGQNLATRRRKPQEKFANKKLTSVTVINLVRLPSEV